MFDKGIKSDRDVRKQSKQTRQQASASDSEEESGNLVDDTTISHIIAHRSPGGSAWKYKVRCSLSGNWSYKAPKDIHVLYKFKVLMDARKRPGAKVSVITGCGHGADDGAATYRYTDDALEFVGVYGNVTTFDGAAGGGSGSSSAMDDGDASIHPVGPCPSDSADAPLGSLNAGDSEEESDDSEYGDVVYHDKAARCVGFSAANLMRAAGDPAGALAIAHRAPKGMLLKQLAVMIKKTAIGKKGKTLICKTLM